MRQAGVLAAAALLALEESPKRLIEDHENAQRLAQALSEMPGVKLDAKNVVTNIVIFGVDPKGPTASELCAALAKRGVLAAGVGKHSVRMVTHCDVTRAGIDRAIAATKEALTASA
jgi:threonine aldolase